VSNIIIITGLKYSGNHLIFLATMRGQIDKIIVIYKNCLRFDLAIVNISI